MIDTKLILIEGIPGSGKSTTTMNLAAEISKRGIKCQCHLEWAEDNPIFIGHMEDLSEVISSSKLREQDVLQQWRSFTKKTKQQAAVIVIESRFWQTDAMYLYLSGHSEDEVMKGNKGVISAISELNPVLIYLAPEDVAQMLMWTAKVKNRKWQESGREGSWDQWGNEVYEQQRWFTNRMLKGPEAMVKFFNEWTSIANRLYEELPFRKAKIQNPNADWDTTMSRIRHFLKID